MTAKIFVNKEYESLFRKWWLDWYGDDIGSHALSSYGVIAKDGDTPLGITHIYPCYTASLVMVGFTAVDPKLSKHKAGRVVKLLIEAAEYEARQAGFKLLYTQFEHTGLQRLVESRDYKRGGECVEYWKGF